jgi:autotransporter-associated beta strand protein
MGGAIFVMDGGSLIARGDITVTRDTVVAGAHGGSAQDGSAFGAGLFLNGNGTIRFSPGNGQTERVHNAIDDEAGLEANGYTPPGGFTPGSYKLVKSGLGTLILSADNTYSGGTTLKAGTLELKALSAAGIGAITFKGTATLEIGNAALSGLFNPIDFFAKHDVLDLTGLKFHAHAKAKYDAATHILSVHSGGTTDMLTLVHPQGKHFTVSADGHGGTEVILDPPAVAATVVASLPTHDFGGHHSATDILSSGHQGGDFLFVV